jgi:GxxExxY protein
MSTLSENEISSIVLETAFNIHTELGPGLLESVYEEIMFYELTHKHGLNVIRQQAVPVTWKGVKMEIGFRADLVIENKVIVELKSVQALADIHAKQVLTYIRQSNIKLGMLINFNEALLKNGIKRVVNGL